MVETREVPAETAAELKKRLRRQAKTLAASMSREERERADAEIVTRILLSPNFQQADTVFCYVNMAGEPETKTILEAALQMGKTVAVPRCREKGVMDAVPIQSMEQLKPRTMGILEPDPELPCMDAYQFDLAILPCVMAGKRGERLGHGAGYYDRFLHGLSILKFCLCYEKLLSDEIPMELTDIRMDRIYTEEKCYHPLPAAEGLGGPMGKRSREKGGILAAFRSLLRNKS